MAPPTPATAQTGYLKVPKFIPHAPLVWVQLCKAQFEVLQITDEQQKYNRILSSLSPEVIVAQVGDLIVTPFAAGHLEQLFDTIVEAFSASAIKRLRDVLDNEEQGDRKPSVFYKSMRTKVKDLNVSDDVFYDRWISRLDPQIQTTIAAAKPIAGMTIDQILQIADNVYDHLSSTRSSTSTVSAIGQRQQHHSRGRSFSRNRSASRDSRGRSPFRRSQSPGRAFNDSGPLCWYHFKFGRDARKCTQPCKFKKHSGNASPSQ